MFPETPRSSDVTLEQLERILAPESLDLPAQPEIVALRAEPSEFVSEDALRVWIIVPDSTPEEQLDLAHLRPIREAVERAFEEHGVFLIPLAKFRTVSEFEEETGEQL